MSDQTERAGVEISGPQTAGAGSAGTAANSDQGPGARRSNRRDGAGFQFLLQLDDQLRPVEATSSALMDVSDRGCGLMQAHPAETGTRYGIVLMRRGEFVPKLAEARYSKTESNGWTRVGLEFAPLPHELATCYLKFVSERFGFPMASAA